MPTVTFQRLSGEPKETPASVTRVPPSSLPVDGQHENTTGG